MEIFARSPKTRIFWKSAKGGPREIWQKLPKKLPLFERPRSENSGSKSARMAKLWQFSQRQPKAAFSEKVQRGHQGKFVKNRLKSSPRLKGPKALWRKWHYPLISMHLNCKDWTRLRRKQRLQKCQNNQVMAIFQRSPKTRIFWNSAKGGPKEISQKSPKK